MRQRFFTSVKVILSVIILFSISMGGFSMNLNTVIKAASENQYNIFILKADSLVDKKAEQADCDIENIRALYAGAGHTISLIDIADLCDYNTFSHKLCDILILPYGPKFPYSGVSALKHFFANGGRIITLGGYAFEDIVEDWKQAGSEEAEMCLSVNASAATERSEFKRTIDLKSLKGKKSVEAVVWQKAQELVPADGGGAFAELTFYNGSTKNSTVSINILSAAYTPWSRFQKKIDIPDNTTSIEISVGLRNAQGQVSIDNIGLYDENGSALFEDRFNYVSQGIWTQQTTHAAASLFQEESYPSNPKLSSVTPDTVSDWLSFSASSIPIFDADHKIKNAVRIGPAEEQSVFTEEVSLDGAIEGWSSVCVLGNNRGRLQPLMYAYDGDGEIRGTVGAIMHLLPSPASGGQDNVNEWTDYKATSIAFFGITSQDILSPKNKAVREGFLRLPYIMMKDTYVSKIENKYDCYRQGESAEFTANIENSSAVPVSGKIKFTVSDGNGKAVFSTETDYAAGAKSVSAAVGRWDPQKFSYDFYTVKSELYDGQSQLIDVNFTGFTVWDDAVVNAGPSYELIDNYIVFTDKSGKKQPVMINGADDGGNTFGMLDTTPLKWRENFIRRNDMGMHLYEALMVYTSMSGGSEQFMRKMDNVVYLAQKYNQIFMMGILIGNNVAVNDRGLEKDAEICKKVAERYKDIPGLIYYLNGDLRVQITQSLFEPLNQFLAAKYPDDAALKNAWGSQYALGSVTPEEYPQNGTGWSDVKAADYNEFRTFMIKRWTGKLTESIQSVDKSGKAILCEFYSYPWESVDIPTGLGDLTYSNIGFFETYREITQTLAYTDQRYRGKSLGIGEFGKRTHPVFMNAGNEIHSALSPTEAANHFFNVYNATFTAGGNHVQIWSWQDESKYVFPWGLLQLGDRAPRDLFYYFRNMNLYTRLLSPVYETPQAAFLTADSTRMGGSEGGGARGHFADIAGLNILQSTNAGKLLTLNDSNLVIPKETKVIFYPVAYNPTDEVMDKLTEFVKNGGVLYLSGDISYDRNRDQTKPSRLLDLCGVSLISTNFNGVDFSGDEITYSDGKNSNTGIPNIKIALAGASALYKEKDGTPIVTEYALGKGKVLFSAVAIELFSDYKTAPSFADTAIYKYVLDLAGVPCLNVTAKDSYIKILEQPLSNSQTSYGIFNMDTSNQTMSFISAGNEYSLTLLSGQTANLRRNENGEVLSVFNEGDFKVNGTAILDNAANAMILSRDETDITKSKSLIITPNKTGRITLHTKADFKAPVIAAGVMIDGVLKVTSKTSVTFKGKISFEVTEELKNKIIFITEESDLLQLAANTAYNLQNPVTAKLSDQVSANVLIDGKNNILTIRSVNPALLILICALGVAFLCPLGGLIYVTRKKAKKRKL